MTDPKLRTELEELLGLIEVMRENEHLEEEQVVGLFESIGKALGRSRVRRRKELLEQHVKEARERGEALRGKEGPSVYQVLENLDVLESLEGLQVIDVLLELEEMGALTGADVNDAMEFLGERCPDIAPGVGRLH